MMTTQMQRTTQGSPDASAVYANSPTVERGFLPVVDPLTELPAAYAPWEEICTDLPRLLAADRARSAVRDLPTLDDNALDTDAQRERAMLLLSYIGHAHVFGGPEPCATIPACVALPWSSVASKLGRPPVLSYASHALQNWRRFDVTEAVALGNIARLTNFLGGMDEDWFVLVHVAIEGAAGRGLASAMNMSSAVAARDESMVEEYLADIGDALERMIGILRRMPEKCDPYVYYLRVRQFIFGWTEIPGGVTYEGVSAFSGPQSFRGETGAQSAIIPAFDTVLEIGFGSDDELARHQVELTSYMPPAHRATLQSLRNSGVRDFTVGSHRLSLRQTYNRAIRLSANFREHHGGFARAYIAKQTQTSAANPTATGTGGTPFMTYLEQHVRQVQAHEIPV